MIVIDILIVSIVIITISLKVYCSILRLKIKLKLTANHHHISSSSCNESKLNMSNTSTSCISKIKVEQENQTEQSYSKWAVLFESLSSHTCAVNDINFLRALQILIISTITQTVSLKADELRSLMTQIQYCFTLMKKSDHLIMTDFSLKLFWLRMCLYFSRTISRVVLMSTVASADILIHFWMRIWQLSEKRMKNSVYTLLLSLNLICCDSVSLSFIFCFDIWGLIPCVCNIWSCSYSRPHFTASMCRHCSECTVTVSLRQWYWVASEFLEFIIFQSFQPLTK